MALSRRSGQRFQGAIWPGFVDAMTALLLVLIFVLTIFMVVQSIQSEQILGQETELDRLTARVTELGRALGAEQQRASGLEDTVAGLEGDIAAAQSQVALQQALVTSLTARARDQAERLTALETELATVGADRDAAMERADALDLALAQARDEIDAGTEAARLAAARREALEALVADLETREAELGEEVAAQAEALSEAEAARLADAAAAEALRERLAEADAELDSLTLALEAERQQAEETLTLLAAAELARDDALAGLGEAKAEAAAALSEAERRAALLAVANDTLAEAEAAGAETARDLALLNRQLVDARDQMARLQGLLDAAEARDAEAEVQIENLGTRLNSALAQVAAEQRRRADLEEAERIRLQEEAERLEEEARRLENFRSDFFGRLRDILGDVEGVRIVGDRFVFSSEVLFESGSAELSLEGAAEIAKVGAVLRDVAAELPQDVAWIIRVDGHTDDVPLTGAGRFRDNWELSQGRALSVVQFLIDAYGFPPERLAATGFGEYQPIDTGDSPEARARNRRIEIKLTER